ncbi:hypothetical protein JOM56_001904 [Amanita muscaria]
MSVSDLPLKRAHQHALNAEDHFNNGLLVLAAEEHSKAAEAYLAAVERSNDESAKRTLRMLYNRHSKTGKDIQRKIDKLKQEGKDPNLPHKPERPASPPVRGIQPVGHQNTQNSATSSPPSRPMIDTVDESFMLLGGQRSEPGDAFNQFWNIMQGMLDTLSQPVAFATVPLAVDGSKSPPGAETPQPKKDDNNASDTEVEEHIFARLSKRVGITREPSKLRNNGALSSDEFEDVDDFSEDDESDSFYLISTEKDHTSASALKSENASLKTELETLQKRLATMERVIQLRKEQDMQLRDSIFQATREAQRVMGASMLAPRPGVETGSPTPSLSSGREAQYIHRIKELEEEARNMRVENDKNKAMITKYRERWEKLKESAKRKKEAKAGASSVVRERIVEEPEAEELVVE